MKNINLQNQDDESIDRNICRTIVGYQRELHELERKITYLFTEGMSIQEISEYILFELDAQEYFVNSSK